MILNRALEINGPKIAIWARGLEVKVNLSSLWLCKSNIAAKVDLSSRVGDCLIPPSIS
jgi:hypothetical protein